jgi:hypothetical protein
MTGTATCGTPSVGKLLDRCLRVVNDGAKRYPYPDGYGFALAYLDDDLNPAWLRDGANQIVSQVYANGRQYAVDRKHPDLVRYVNAYAEGKSAEDWMIEAAQLVLAEAMAGYPPAMSVMKLCGHPGY